MPTRVVNIRTYRGKVVYVGRPSPWGNPFKIGPDGSREEVIKKYEDWVRHSDDPKARWIKEHLHQIKHKVLGCWCAPKPCHADVLVRLAQEGLVEASGNSSGYPLTPVSSGLR